MTQKFKDYYYFQFSHYRNKDDSSSIKDFLDIQFTFPDLNDDRRAFYIAGYITTNSENIISAPHDVSCIQRFDETYHHIVLNQKSVMIPNDVKVYEKYPIAGSDIPGFLESMSHRISELVDAVEFPASTKLKVNERFHEYITKTLYNSEFTDFTRKFESMRLSIQMELRLDIKASRSSIKI